MSLSSPPINFPLSWNSTAQTSYLPLSWPPTVTGLYFCVWFCLFCVSLLFPLFSHIVISFAGDWFLDCTVCAACLASEFAARPSPFPRSRLPHFLQVFVAWWICAFALILSKTPRQSWTLMVLKVLPSRFLSRMLGKINKRPLPRWARAPVYAIWTFLFHCNLDEMRYPLSHYTCLAEFFTRPLKEGVRPVAPATMVYLDSVL